MAKNVAITMDGNTMTIKIDVTKNLGASKSGKTMIIATTEGNQVVGQDAATGKNIILGLNLYK
jgi:hypothetical protein